MSKIESFCGLECHDCNYKEKCNCNGCSSSNGHPFYGECKVAECAKSKNIRFCGECGEFPCELLHSYSFDKEQGDHGARIEHCKELKRELVEEARRGIDPISVCGHHCDYCFLGEWCGGCRSNYNCCSYATLFPDQTCPNVSCAKEKGFDGCYECPDLEDCHTGFYEKEYNEENKEFVAKATALFIRTYGKEQYTKTLKTAIESGCSYPKTFDETNSVLDAYRLLEKYREQ